MELLGSERRGLPECLHVFLNGSFNLRAQWAHEPN